MPSSWRVLPAWEVRNCTPWPATLRGSTRRRSAGSDRRLRPCQSDTAAAPPLEQKNALHSGSSGKKELLSKCGKGSSAHEDVETALHITRVPVIASLSWATEATQSSHLSLF